MFQVRAADVVPTPWRNGRGRTRELPAQPAGPDWTIRVSMADIDTDGPFSAFPGGRGRRLVPARGGNLLFDLPDSPGRFVPDGQGPCGWWLGTSVAAA